MTTPSQPPRLRPSRVGQQLRLLPHRGAQSRFNATKCGTARISPDLGNIGGMTHPRPDLSTKLVHLVKGDTTEVALGVLMAILDQKKLRGGNGKIRGGYTCVCFTESPLAQLCLSLSRREANQFKYRPLGIMVDKDWAFEKGARPAIYQPDEEFNLLPEELRYRHVRYEPANQVDFTWEREWRLKTDKLSIEPKDVTVLVPQRNWADTLIEIHTDEVRQSVAKLGDAAVKPYPWHMIVLSDLGIDVPGDL